MRGLLATVFTIGVVLDRALSHAIRACERYDLQLLDLAHRVAMPILDSLDSVVYLGAYSAVVDDFEWFPWRCGILVIATSDHLRGNLSRDLMLLLLL